MAGDERQANLDRIQADVVVRPDGRYLIYYSWPDEREDEDDQPADRAAHPDQQPWITEAGPADV